MNQEILDALRGAEGSFQETEVPSVTKASDDAESGDTSSVTALAGVAPCHLASRSFCWENLPPADFPSAKVLEGKALRAVGDAGPYEGDGENADDPSGAARRLPLRRGGEPLPPLRGTSPGGGGDEALPPQSLRDSSPIGGAKETSGADFGEIRAHWEKLAAEAAGLEGFDLREALRDPAFVRLTAPGVGVSVEDAWYALHRREAMRRDEQEGRQRLAQAVAASSRRPREGGGGASALIAADYRSLSRAEQLRVKKRIAEAASRGEKIYP